MLFCGMKDEDLHLFSPFPPEQCVSRLTAAIDRERPISLTTFFGSKPVIGYVTESSLRLRKRITYRNSWQRHLTATMRPVGGGTTICGSFSLHRFVRAFMAFWFCGVIIFAFVGVVIFVTSLTSGGSGHGVWVVIVIAPVMLAFGSALVRFGEFLSRDEGRFLKDFLVRTLNAEERSDHEDASPHGPAAHGYND
jgi:hypothetical protein